jgi:cytoskeletal protein CcmA (bactofilin family)
VIEEQGSLNAEVRAREVIIHGSVTGNIRGDERVRIEATGHVSGDIFSEQFSVEEGAELQGRVVMGPADVLDRESPFRRADDKPVNDDPAIVNISTYQAHAADNADLTPENKKPS